MLDPWQQEVLHGALGERPDGKWAAFEVGVVVPRQNGKGSILEARELAGLFLFGERLILHSAHEFKTAKDAYQRIRGLIESTPDLDRLVNQYRYSNEEVSIELVDRRKLRFIARSTGSGRGFTGDVVILDEAYQLSPEAVAALLPTMSARPNPQLWYTSSAPLLGSAVLRSLCKRGRRGGAAALAYFEWCAAAADASDDREAWAVANPALGARISEEFVVNELDAFVTGGMEPEWRRERLGLWHDADAEFVIDPKVWESLADHSSTLTEPIALAVDATLDRRWATIVAAGRRPDGERHVEITGAPPKRGGPIELDHRQGTGWVVKRLLELVERVKPAAVVLDPGGPAGSFVAPLEDAGVALTLVSARELSHACGQFYDGTMGDETPIHHLDQPPLNVAIAAGRKRPLGDSWAWSRKDSSAAVSPLVAATLALWGVRPPDEVPAEADFFMI